MEEINFRMEEGEKGGGFMKDVLMNICGQDPRLNLFRISTFLPLEKKTEIVLMLNQNLQYNKFNFQSFYIPPWITLITSF